MSGINKIAKSKKCPNGHPVTDDMNFCPICGAEITVAGMRFCPNCGEERLPSDRFCTHCGFPFGQRPIEEKKDDVSFFGFLWIY